LHEAVRNRGTENRREHTVMVSFDSETRRWRPSPERFDEGSHVWFISSGPCRRMIRDTVTPPSIAHRDPQFRTPHPRPLSCYRAHRSGRPAMVCRPSAMAVKWRIQSYRLRGCSPPIGISKVLSESLPCADFTYRHWHSTLPIPLMMCPFYLGI
jgi:hypothetical protein